MKNLKIISLKIISLKIISLTIITFIALTSFTSKSLEAKSITINSIPNTVEEFIQLRNKIAKTPEGGAVVFIVAMMKYSKDKKMGSKFFTISFSRKNLSKGNSYKGFKPARHLNYHLNRFSKEPYWPFIYVQGATPKDGYSKAPPYTFILTRNKYSKTSSSKDIKVFVDCYGVRARPIKLKKNNRGYWKASEFSSFWMGSVPPSKKIDDDL